MYVHFGWDPVLFFLALAVSLGLAFALEKIPAARLLPAFVLYSGLNWDLPGVWPLLVKLGFWFAVIVVIVTMVLPIKTLLTKMPLIIISVVLVFGVMGNAWNWASGTDSDVPTARPAPAVSTTPTPSATPSPDLGAGFTDDTAKDLRDLLPNATKDDVRFGDEVDDSSHVVDAGSAGFGDDNSKTYLETQTDIKDFFASGTKKSEAAKKRVVKAIRKAGYGEDEVARAMSGEGYVKMQLTKASQILGTSYFEGGKVKVLGDWRQSKADDIYWLFISKDGRIVKAALLRADCRNPGATKIRIVTPGIPEKPPVSCPPSKCSPPKEKPPTPDKPEPTCVEIPGNGVADCNPKDPSKEPAQRGNVPEPVKGTNPPPKDEHKQPTKPQDPPPVYTPPAAPKPSKPPVGSTPAPTTPPPPAETGSNPGNGGDNTGDPGGF